MEPVACSLLRQLEASYQLDIKGGWDTSAPDAETWVFEAASRNTSERWRGVAPSPYEAACALARALGFELCDG